MFFSPVLGSSGRKQIRFVKTSETLEEGVSAAEGKQMNHNMESMEIRKLVLSMSLPIIISMLVQALYNIVDSVFVAGISQDALLSVSLCYPVQTVMVAVACGTGAGFNTVLAGFLGQKNYRNADLTAVHGIILALLSGAVTAAAGLLCAGWFLSFFTEKPQVLEMGTDYIRICTAFSFGVYVQITYERIMQATGNAFYNMIMQGFGAVVNIILDPVLIYGLWGVPALGVSGAAIATVAGQILAMITGVMLVRTKVRVLHIRLQGFRWSWHITARIYRIGIPAILMQSVMSLMTVFMNMILSVFSMTAISVFSIYYKLQQFVFMAVSGMTNALIPIAAYNNGARLPSRVVQAADFSLYTAVGIMLAGTIVFEVFPHPLLSLFHADRSMYDIGIPALRIISLSFAAAGITIIIAAVLQALEMARVSLFLTLLRQMVLLLPMAWVLASFFGMNACWWAFPITETVTAAAAFWVWKRVRADLLAE